MTHNEFRSGRPQESLPEAEEPRPPDQEATDEVVVTDTSPDTVQAELAETDQTTPAGLFVEPTDITAESPEELTTATFEIHTEPTEATVEPPMESDEPVDDQKQGLHEVLDTVHARTLSLLRKAVEGEIEESHTDIEPLPLTPITADAEECLRSWGVPDGLIAPLRELTASMRYDCCPEKVAQITEKGGLLGEDTEGNPEIVLPAFLDFSRLEGQCSELTVGLVRLMHATNYLTEVNKVLEEVGRPPLEIVMAVGSARTHFTGEGDVHYWLGLVPEGMGEDQAVTIDPSLQEISLAANNEYKARATSRNPDYLPGRSLAVAIPVIPIVETIDGKLVEQTASNGLTPLIGTSGDGELVYGFTFLKSESETIFPFVTATRFDGSAYAFCSVDDNGKEMSAGLQKLN